MLFAGEEKLIEWAIGFSVPKTQGVATGEAIRKDGQ
jgi:hypothetical protein